jgi:ABC-type Fe3+ transport system permease subunit
MKIFLRNKKAQSFLEYVTLILVVSGALVAMYTYMQRSVNARLKQIQVELDETRR